MSDRDKLLELFKKTEKDINIEDEYGNEVYVDSIYMDDEGFIFIKIFS